SPGASRAFATTEAGGSHAVRALHQFSDGTIMAGTYGGGLAVFETGKFRRYKVEHGLSDDIIVSLGEDFEGNRWLGTLAGGVIKLAFNGFVSYGPADGFSELRVLSIFKATAGEVCVAGRHWQIQCFDGRSFAGVELTLPRARRTHPRAELDLHPVIQDHTGDWWVGSGEGVFRFAPVDRLKTLAIAHPKATYTLANDIVDVLFEDSHGDIWIGTHPRGIAKWERTTRTLHQYFEADGFPRDAH